MKRNPGCQDFTTHTRTHTVHTVTHAHTRTHTHTHTHAHAHAHTHTSYTQEQAHAHKHIQTHANTRTQNTNTHHTSCRQSPSCLTVCQPLCWGHKQTIKLHQVTVQCNPWCPLSRHACMQGIENSELIYTPAYETTLFQCGACKTDSASAKPTAVWQHNIKLQETAIRAQPGDNSGSEVQSWALDGDRHNLAMVILREETSYVPIL